MVIPSDMPNPSHENYSDTVCKNVWEAILASRGNVFVLFTSYALLQKCHEVLAPQLQQYRFTVFKQGESSRKTLLDQFKVTDRSILFGTDSFWEGVDVVGEALRCVIIVKLPFRVPSEPITQARTENISAKGGDPFFDYSVPTAIVKFKQGFGRLIRNKKDRGCILCLDPRLINKGYGPLFLKSLPSCSHAILPSNEIQKQMQAFYRKTYRLTLQ